MEIKITAEPIAWVPLTSQQVDILITCSQLHYDMLCRRASEVGGFIFGWKNSTRWADEEGDPVPEQKVTLSHIDRCRKILEVQPPTLDLEILRGRHDLDALLRCLAEELISTRESWIYTATLELP